MEITGRDYRTGEPIRLTIEGDRITDRMRATVADESNELPWICPGFVDLQSNGYGGQEFSSPSLTVEHVDSITRQHWRFGVTQYLPTVTTASFETLQHAMRIIAATVEQSRSVSRSIAGIHLEGPYISSADGARGAHPREHCRTPDWDEFQKLQTAAYGRIKLVTLSPEYDSSIDFIRQAAAAGVTVSIGHTSATSDQIRAAVDAGASMSTHLGNGAPAIIRRHPNPIWDQLADDRLTASVIVDGHHLPPEVVKVFVRAKTPQRLVLVSDLSGMAGLPPGRYETSLCALEVLSDGRLVVAGQDQLLAGASRPIGVGVALAMQFAGLSLEQAADMATVRPAKLIGCRCGGLEPGDAGDLVVFRLSEPLTEIGETFKILSTLLAGELVYDRSAERR